MQVRDLIPMRTLPRTVDAKHFNRVRLALLRLSNPLRVSLDAIGDADIILADEQWLCVDRSRDDMPLMAWRDFEVKQRAAIHEPIACTLHFYHAHAGMLMGKVLPALDEVLDLRLSGK